MRLFFKILIFRFFRMFCNVSEGSLFDLFDILRQTGFSKAPSFTILETLLQSFQNSKRGGF